MPNTVVENINAILLQDENVATLIYSDAKKITYEIKYEIDPFLALTFGCEKVKISIKKNEIRKTQTQQPRPTSARGLVSTILNSTATSMNSVRENINNVLFSYYSDFTKSLSDEYITKLKLTNEKQPLPAKRIFVPKSIQEQKLNNSPIQLLEFSKNKQNNKTIDLAKYSGVNLLEFGIDPANAVVDANSEISFSKDIFNGVARYKIEKFENDFVKNSISSFLNELKIKTIKPNKKELSLSDQIIVQELVLEDTVEIKEKITLSTDLINRDEFFIIFELLSKNNVVKQTVKYLVPHDKNVAFYETPKNSPLLDVVKTRIGNKLTVKQLDPAGLGIEIYKKTISKTSDKSNLNYQFVKSINLSFNQTATYIDKCFNEDTTIYRAIAFGIGNNKSSSFSSFVLSDKKNKYISAIYKVYSDGIQIELRDIPPNVISIQTYRKNLSTFSQRETFQNPIFIEASNDQNLILIKDTTVEKRKIYNYSFELIYKSGFKEFSTTEIVVEFLPETKNITNTKINNPRIIKLSTGDDIAFELETNFFETESVILRNLLSETGLAQYFNDSINKETLEQLIVYNIVRTNITTGEIENLGLTTSKNIFDSALSTNSNAKKIVSGNSYMYTVNTLLRTPETSIKDYSITVTDPVYETKTYTYNPWTWKHFITLNDGNIVTEKTLKTNYSKNLFSFGEVGNITTVTLSLTETLPYILNNPQVLKINNAYKIIWTTQGNNQKIDHFIIMVELLGMRTVIGTAHSLTNNHSFEFIFENKNKIIGEVKFIIVPIFHDYIFGSEASTDRIIIQ